MNQDIASRLRRFFDGPRGTWWPSDVGFERRDDVSVDGVRWRIVYKIQAVRFARSRPDRVRLSSSITVWPATRRARARERASWRRAFQREVQRHGYRGRWEASRHGQFGHFWKRLRDIRAVRREVTALPLVGVMAAAGRALPRRRP
jgi:hypothetical protein